MFRLRYLHHDFELPPGRFLIGRSTDCQLSLDDPLVSRKHALLLVTKDTVEVQDLGSRNGVLVNKVRITKARAIHHGDRITIGSQEMLISVPSDEAATARSIDSHSCGANVTVTAMQPVRAAQLDRQTKSETGTSKRDAFRLLGGVADKALVLGRAEEAERLLSTILRNVLTSAQSGAELDAHLVEQAGLYGAKLANATGKAQWVNYVIELHTILRQPCAGLTIDELHTVLRKVKNVDLPALQAYVAILRKESQNLGPAQRFLVQRIEGLERLLCLGN